MKIKTYRILGILLLVSFSTVSFSQDEATINEVRRLRANAAYLEMKGDLEGALKDFEKSLELIPDEKIEAKVQEVKAALGLIDPTTEPEVEPPDAPKIDEAEPPLEVVPDTQEEAVPEKTEPEQITTIPEDEGVDTIDEEPEETANPDTLPADLIAAIEAANLSEHERLGLDLADLKGYFSEKLQEAADEEAAREVFRELMRAMDHYLWQDIEGMLVLHKTFLERYPDSEDSEDLQEEIIELAAKCYRWDQVIAHYQSLLNKYREEENEYREMSALLELIHFNLCKGDLPQAQSLFEEMKQLDPTIHDDQTRTADFIFRNLDNLVIPEPDPETIAKPDADFRILIRKYVKIREIIEMPGDWYLTEPQLEELDKIQLKVATELHEQSEKRFYKSIGHYFLTSTSEKLMTDDEWVQTALSFIDNYWYDERADEIKGQLEEYYSEQGDLTAIASLNEKLLWEDIDRINSNVDEYYRAIELAEAWKEAGELQNAKKWYEVAIDLDQYGEWSKTDGVNAALAEIVAQLPPEPEIELPELSKEEQETLAADIMSKLSSLPENQVREFEKGYLEIIERCPESTAAEEAYWRIGNLYRLAYSEPKNDKVIPLYEQFLERYPESEGVPMIANALANSLSEVENWNRLVEVEAEYFLWMLPDEPTDQDIARYSLHGDHLAKAGKTDEALRWYALVLKLDPNRNTFSSRVAESALEELGYSSPEAIAAIPTAVAYE